MNRHDHRTVQKPRLEPGIVHQLFAKPKRHKATATMSDRDWDSDVPSVKLSTAFMVILFLHVAVVGGVMLFRFLDQEGDPVQMAPASPAGESRPEVPAINPAGIRLDDPALAGLPRHQVKPHETLDSIAGKFGVTRNELTRTNRINAENPFRIGMTLVIPPREARAEQPSAPVAAAPAAARDVPVARARRVDEPPAVVTAGGREVPPPPRARPVSDTTASVRTPAPAAQTEHVVKPGETLWGISRNYNVSVDRLMQVNAITDATRLRVGATLRIP